MKLTSEEETVTIRLKDVPEYIHKDLVAISKNLGIPLTDVLRPKIKAISNQSEMLVCKFEHEKGKTIEMAITGVPVSVQKTIEDNARGFKIPKTWYLHCWLSQIVASFPPHLKRPPRVY